MPGTRKRTRTSIHASARRRFGRQADPRAGVGRLYQCDDLIADGERVLSPHRDCYRLSDCYPLASDSPDARSLVLDHSLTQPLAIWGALLSTLLVGVTLFDFWKRRFRISTTYDFADITRGNRILVTNLNGAPVTLLYWELLWLSRRWPRLRQSRTSISPEENLSCVVIASGETHCLRFEGPNYFDWGENALNDDLIYLRLYFAGKRPLLRRIYGRWNIRR